MFPINGLCMDIVDDKWKVARNLIQLAIGGDAATKAFVGVYESFNLAYLRRL